MTLDNWGDLAFGWFAIEIFLLGGMYLLSTRWYRTPVGRSIGGFFIAVIVTMVWSFLRVFDIVPLTGQAIEILRVILYGLLAIATGGMLVGFVLAQYLGRGFPSRNRDQGGSIR